VLPAMMMQVARAMRMATSIASIDEAGGQFEDGYQQVLPAMMHAMARAMRMATSVTSNDDPGGQSHEDGHKCYQQ